MFVINSVVSDEDHSVMACMPNSDVDGQLSKYKESYVTSVSQCVDECNGDKPSGKDVKNVLAAIAVCISKTCQIISRGCKKLVPVTKKP